jgi:hypothetical protein
MYASCWLLTKVEDLPLESGASDAGSLEALDI